MCESRVSLYRGTRSRCHSLSSWYSVTLRSLCSVTLHSWCSVTLSSWCFVTSVPGVPSPSVPSHSTRVAGSSQQSVENQVLLQTVERLISAAQQKGLPYDFSLLSGFVSSGSVKFRLLDPFSEFMTPPVHGTNTILCCPFW